ncbi:helix-hairpin-helix domain-containing protein [Streptomyces sp. PR69]|uniref:helix-hairpin-helix domain-containing protein n=1 Tax=Streptomyces sp. PR69 TaxID=2984950 RepID=UPI0022641A99|nr:helix-hairpin-helix domain-containing protein [Streptomyces sp. PR69]
MTVPSRGTDPGTPAAAGSSGGGPEPADAPEATQPAHAADATETAEAVAETADAGGPEAGGPQGGGSQGGGSQGGEPDSGTAGSDAGAAAGEAGAGDEESGPETGEVSEAEAELAAQRELRARIEERKAAKGRPVDSGGKLSGTAAELLAAVRAVESGEKSAAAFFDSPAPPPRKPAPAAAPPVRTRAAEPAPMPPAPDPRTVREAATVLAEGGAPEALAGQVAGVLGERAAQLLREDPWRLLSVPGVRPEQADAFARALLGSECGPGDRRRAVALVSWLLERAALQGHTALESSAVRRALAGQSVPDPEEALRQAVAEGAVLVFQDGLEEEAAAPEAAGVSEEAGSEEAGSGEESPVPVFLGLDRYALAEESLADGLARLVKTRHGEAWEGPELVRAVGAQGVVLHTGGEAARAEAAAVAQTARERGLRAAVAVHSENGRRRLGPEAVTVAGLLSGEQGPGRDEEGAFALDVLAVLDAPQLDVETAATLVESLPDGCRLLLSGDPAVLGSAGAGRVFQDVLAADVCPRIASRTPDPGPIGELVSGIGAGELNEVAAPGREVVIVPVHDAGEAVHRTVQLVADSVPRALGVPAEDTQVITVAHGGAAGTRALNAALKQRLNPGPGRFGGFDPGDRVAYAPAPGRTVMGTVVSADAEGLHLECESGSITVPRARVGSMLRHGWAVTAHQASAMRWAAVVAVVPGDAGAALSRAWAYTAFSRGERHLSVVHGAEKALVEAVTSRPAPGRTTRLRELLMRILAVAE